MTKPKNRAAGKPGAQTIAVGCLGAIAGAIVATTAAVVAVACLLWPTTLPVPRLSDDHKSILSGNDVLLAIDNDAIFDYFKTTNQPCSDPGTAATPFCTDRAVFKAQTSFEAIMPSPDKKAIGFSIQTQSLGTETAAGMFYPYRGEHKVHMLTDLYATNVVISFSPNGASFVYVNNCWEGMCGLTIKNTDTLATEKLINNTNPIDARQEDTLFIRWLTDRKVEYRLVNLVNSAVSKTEQTSF